MQMAGIHSSLVLIFVSMPKASVDENDGFILGQNYIWFTGEPFIM